MKKGLEVGVKGFRQGMEFFKRVDYKQGAEYAYRAFKHPVGNAVFSTTVSLLLFIEANRRSEQMQNESIERSEKDNNMQDLRHVANTVDDLIRDHARLNKESFQFDQRIAAANAMIRNMERELESNKKVLGTAQNKLEKLKEKRENSYFSSYSDKMVNVKIDIRSSKIEVEKISSKIASKKTEIKCMCNQRNAVDEHIDIIGERLRVKAVEMRSNPAYASNPEFVSLYKHLEFELAKSDSIKVRQSSELYQQLEGISATDHIDNLTDESGRVIKFS